MPNNTPIADGQTTSPTTLRKNTIYSMPYHQYINSDFYVSDIQKIKQNITTEMNDLAKNTKGLPNDTSIIFYSKDYFQALPYTADYNDPYKHIPLHEVLLAIEEHQKTLKNNQNDSTQCTLNGLKLDFHFVPIRPYSIYHEYSFTDTQKIYHWGGHSEKETIYPFLTLLEMIRKGLLPENVSLALNCPYGLHTPYRTHQLDKEFSKKFPIRVVSLDPNYENTTYFKSIAEAIGEGNLKEGTSITLSVCDESMWRLNYMEKNITEKEVDALIEALKKAPKKFKLILDYKKNLGKNDLLYSKMMKAIEDGEVPEDFSVHFIGEKNNKRSEDQLASAIKNTQKNVHIGMLESYFIEKNTKLEKAFNHQDNHQKSAYDHSNMTKASIYALPSQDYPINASHSQKLSTLKTQINNSACAGKLFTIDDLDLNNLIDSMGTASQSDFEKNPTIELLLKTPIFELIQSLGNDSFLANLFFGVHIGEKKEMPTENILRKDGTIQFNYHYFCFRRSAVILLQRKIQNLKTYIKEKNIEKITQTLKLIQSFQEINSTMHLISKNIWKDADRDPKHTSILFHEIIDTVAQSYSSFVSNQEAPDVCNLVYKGLEEKLSKIIEKKQKCDNINNKSFKKMIDKISEWCEKRTISPPPPGIIKRSLITITKTTTDLSKKLVSLIASKKDSKDNNEKTTQQFTNYQKNISYSPILNNSKIVTDQKNSDKNKYYQKNIKETAQKGYLLTPEKQKNRGDSNRSFLTNIGNTIQNGVRTCVSKVRNWFSNSNEDISIKKCQQQYDTLLSERCELEKRRKEIKNKTDKKTQEQVVVKPITNANNPTTTPPSSPSNTSKKRFSFANNIRSAFFKSPAPLRHNPSASGGPSHDDAGNDLSSRNKKKGKRPCLA